VQAIVAGLEAAGYLTRSRVGRRTRYTVDPDSPFRHSAQQGLRVGPMLEQLTAMAGLDDAHAPAASPSRRPLQSRGGRPCPGRGFSAVDLVPLGVDGRIADQFTVRDHAASAARFAAAETEAQRRQVNGPHVSGLWIGTSRSRRTGGTPCGSCPQA